jgi:hypothetical protein
MMRNHAVWLSVFLLALAVLPACAEQGRAVDEVAVGEEFVLAPEQTVVVAGEDLQLTFVEVTSDNRCPIGAECIVAGEAKCLVEVTRNGSSEPLNLVQPGSSEPPEMDYLDYTITFDVRPYPELGKEILPEDYRLHLTVNRS